MNIFVFGKPKGMLDNRMNCIGKKSIDISLSILKNQVQLKNYFQKLWKSYNTTIKPAKPHCILQIMQIATLISGYLKAKSTEFEVYRNYVLRLCGPSSHVCEIKS